MVPKLCSAIISREIRSVRHTNYLNYSINSNVKIHRYVYIKYENFIVDPFSSKPANTHPMQQNTKSSLQWFQTVTIIRHHLKANKFLHFCLGYRGGYLHLLILCSKAKLHLLPFGIPRIFMKWLFRGTRLQKPNIEHV